jgi:hypothetical protein
MRPISSATGMRQRRIVQSSIVDAPKEVARQGAENEEGETPPVENDREMLSHRWMLA